MKSSALIVCSILACFPLSASSQEAVLLEENFDGNSKNEFANRLLAKPQVHLAKGQGTDGSNAIRVDYVGDARGSQRVVVSQPLKKGVTEGTLSFDVKFDDDFQWVRGGKLHGLGPTRIVTGGAATEPGGWSARIMFKEKGRCAYYLYDQNKKSKYGLEETARKSAFKTGKWQHVVLQVTVNDPGKANGAANILIDGQVISRAKGIEFRGKDGPETLINQLFFCTFHGGHTRDYAPVDKSGAFTTVHALYDNFVVKEGIHDE